MTYSSCCTSGSYSSAGYASMHATDSFGIPPSRPRSRPEEAYGSRPEPRYSESRTGAAEGYLGQRETLHAEPDAYSPRRSTPYEPGINKTAASHTSVPVCGNYPSLTSLI